MNNGFIVLHRKILDHPIWKHEGLFHLFVTLLLMASHKEERFLWNGAEQILKRGQLITGRLKLAEITNSPPSTIRDRLKILENLGIIDIKPTTKFSLITIIKYSQYQDKPDKPTSTSDIKPTSNRHQTDTYNNVNNGNNKLVAKATVDLGKFPKADYSIITESYKKIKGVEPKGKEWLPILKEIKLMFQSGRTPTQIVKAMEVCNSLYDDWAMSTIRMKIADVVSGKLGVKTKQGESSLEIKSIKQR